MKRLFALFLRFCHRVNNYALFLHEPVDQEIVQIQYGKPMRVRKHFCTCGKVFYEDEDFDTVYKRWQVLGEKIESSAGFGAAERARQRNEKANL